MDTLIRSIPLIAVVVFASACSTAPSATETGNRSVQPGASASTATPVSSAQSTGDRSTSASSNTSRIVMEDKTLTNEEVKQLFAQGYKPVSRNGEVYYCRREEQLGTRFAEMTCKTAQQMKQLTQESKDMLSSKQRTGGCAAQGAAC